MFRLTANLVYGNPGAVFWSFCSRCTACACSQAVLDVCAPMSCCAMFPTTWFRSVCGLPRLGKRDQRRPTLADVLARSPLAAAVAAATGPSASSSARANAPVLPDATQLDMLTRVAQVRHLSVCLVLWSSLSVSAGTCGSSITLGSEQLPFFLQTRRLFGRLSFLRFAL